MKKKCFAYTDMGGRDNNEDAYIMLNGETRCLFAVADGLGGHDCGEVASKIAVTVIGSLFARPDAAFNITEAIELANAEIVKEQAKTGLGMKTTIAGFYEIDGIGCVFHAGDSRVYLFKDKKLVYQTLDHSVSQLAVFRGEITTDKIRNHKDRSKLCKVLGEEGKVEPSITPLAPHFYDTVLIVSDGFWEYIFEEEMEKLLGESDSPEIWIAKMRKLIAERTGDDNDNNTAIAVSVN